MVNVPGFLPGPSAFIKYLRESWVFIAVIVVLFLVSMGIGYVIPQEAPDTAKALLSGLQDKAGQLADQPLPLMALGIFANNAFGALIALIFGLAAGLFPLFFIISNGMVIGIVLEMIVAKLGVGAGVAVFLLGILPHGIFELPAIFLSTAIGLKLGYHALLSLVKRQDLVTGELMRGLLIFLCWIVPMLLIAAVIETVVTGALVGLFI